MEDEKQEINSKEGQRLKRKEGSRFDLVKQKPGITTRSDHAKAEERIKD